MYLPTLIDKTKKGSMVLGDVEAHHVHDTSPLPVSKMPKRQPMVQVMKCIFRGCSGKQPPQANSKIPCLRFIHVLGILVLFVEQNVLFLERLLDVLLGVFMKRTTPIQQACPFLILHFLSGDTTTINDVNSTPIGHSAVCHEALEIRQSQSMSYHDRIQAPPKLYLDLGIFGLHIADCNGHDLLVLRVIHVASHSAPLLDASDMVKHDPRLLQVPTRLHSFH